MKIDLKFDVGLRDDDGLAAVVVVPESGEAQRLVFPFKDLFSRFGEPDPLLLELLLISASFYVIDKSFARADATIDRWTREFEVSIPVAQPGLWTTAAEELQRALEFLSGDVWRLNFSQFTGALFAPGKMKRNRRITELDSIDCVCLFSGGLDSLAGAIDQLEDGRKVMLVGIHDDDMRGPKSQQERLFAIVRQGHPRACELLQLRISNKVFSDGGKHFAETSQRSRSIIFLASALFVAGAAGAVVPVIAPENGVIAINVPLTPSRGGSCSTRTMHPYFVERLRAALDLLGIKNPIETPYAFLTKGECVVACRNLPLLTSAAPLSVSCSHSGRKQYWLRTKGRSNCGYCVPCIFRRAAMQLIGEDKGREYGINVCSGELQIKDGGDSPDDLRALVAFLSTRLSQDAIKDEILKIATVVDAKNHAATAWRGLEEVRAFFDATVVPKVRKAFGRALP